MSTTTSVGCAVETDDHDQRRWLRLTVAEDLIGVMLLFPCQEILAVPVSLSYANLHPWRCPRAMFSEPTALGSISRREAGDPSGREPVKCPVRDGVFEQHVFAIWILQSCSASLQSRQAVATALHILAIWSIDCAAQTPATTLVYGRNSRSRQETKGRWWLSRRSSAGTA